MDKLILNYYKKKCGLKNILPKNKRWTYTTSVALCGTAGIVLTITLSSICFLYYRNVELLNNTWLFMVYVCNLILISSSVVVLVILNKASKWLK